MVGKIKELVTWVKRGKVWEFSLWLEFCWEAGNLVAAMGKSVRVGRNLIGTHLNVVGIFAVEPLNRIMWLSPAIPDVGEIGSLGNLRMGDCSGGYREIQIANVSTMWVRIWLILCRLKKPERVEGYCDVRGAGCIVLREKWWVLAGSCALLCVLHGWQVEIVLMKDAIPRIHSGVQRTGWREQWEIIVACQNLCLYNSVIDWFV